MGSSLVALQAAGSPLSPVSLITGLDVGEMSGLPVGPGDQVFVDKKTIILFSKSSRIIFRFDEAAIYDSLLRDYTVPLPLLQSPAEKSFRFRKRGISGSRTKADGGRKKRGTGNLL